MDQSQVADLTAFMPTDVSELEIVALGSEKKIGWKVTFAGPAHPQSVAYHDEQRRKRDERARRIELAQVNGRKWKGDGEVDSRREFVEGIVARIVTWSPVKLGDTTYVFDEKSAVELLLRPEMGGFVAQMAEHLYEEASFTKGSALK